MIWDKVGLSGLIWIMKQQKDRSSGLSLMQVFCVVDNEAPGFAPLPLPLTCVTPKCRLMYCKILVFKKWFLNIFQQKKSFDGNWTCGISVNSRTPYLMQLSRLHAWCSWYCYDKEIKRVYPTGRLFWSLSKLHFKYLPTFNNANEASTLK